MKALLYCPNSKPYLVYGCTNKYTMSYGYDTTYSEEIKNNLDCFNGKIIGECDYEIEDIKLIETPEYAGSDCNTFLYDISINFETKTLNEDNLCKQSCLTSEELDKYLGLYKEKEVYGYAIHISNIDVYTDPKKIDNYVKGDWIEYSYGPVFFIPEIIEFAPKNMTFVWSNDNGHQYLFIPVNPEQLCKILNKECSIVIKKRVPKELR